jgi:hypothetical protein
MSSKPALKLDWATHEAAKFAVEHWHYSRNIPKQKMVKVGVWEDGKFIGCVIFGDGANPGMFSPYGISYEGGCELVRVALTKHSTAVSRIVRVALLFVKRACPKLRLVVSFADPEHGHVGGIYQAGGWIYAGMTSAADEYIVNGKRMHGRALRATRGRDGQGGGFINALEWARSRLDPNARIVPGSRKHRYLMPLDDETRSRVLKLAKPYPKKRAGSIDVDASGHQPEEGGSTPTPALNTSVAADV